MDIKETLKKNWKNIVLVILVLFSLSKCTSSCNRNQQIKRMNVEINAKDSTIAAYEHTMEIMNVKQAGLTEYNSNYEKIALGNQKELADKITSLTNENTSLKAKLETSNAENKSLQKKVNTLTNDFEVLKTAYDELKNKSN